METVDVAVRRPKGRNLLEGFQKEALAKESAKRSGSVFLARHSREDRGDGGARERVASAALRAFANACRNFVSNRHPLERHPRLSTEDTSGMPKL
jgi:hypothetical protein